MAAHRSCCNSSRPAWRLSCCLFVAVVLVSAFLPHQVSGQQGFINIDCGLTSASTYQDPTTGLVYTSDTVYIKTGLSSPILSASKVTGDLTTLRYFPASTSPVKNCFDVPVANDTTYLIRAWFYFGDYVPAPPSGRVQFKLALDASDWAQLSLNVTNNFYYWAEAVFQTAKPSVSVCLIRVEGGGDPFISTLELRPLSATSYFSTSTRRFADPHAQFLYNVDRVNFGGTGTVRYPDDTFDRLWVGLSAAEGQGLTDVFGPNYPATAITFNTSFLNDFPPSVVMASAITAPQSFTYTRPGFGNQTSIYASLLFAELNVTLPGKRVINVQTNFLNPSNPNNVDEQDLSSVGPPLTVLQATAAQATVAAPVDPILFNLSRADTSAADPLLNALEIYQIKSVLPGTSIQDADALASLKTLLQLGQWNGDPCFPVPWDEVTCVSNRVTSLDLSNNNLSGLIPDDIGQLTALTSLDLSNNGFTGSLPAWVGELRLDTLDVSNNQLSGNFPATYITSIPTFRYSGNSQLRCVDSGNNVCPTQTTPPSTTPPGPPTPRAPPPSGTPATPSSKTSIGPIIGGIAGGIVAILFVGGLLIWFCRSRRGPAKTQAPSTLDSYDTSSGTKGSPVNVSVIRKQAQQTFTLSAIKEATHNYARKLGEGGFGPVYFGVLPNRQEVAVKVMSGKTQQGFSEFTNEIELLSTVHFKKLVSLVGYCQEGADLILLYEYMSGGDLRNRLYGPQAAQSPLNWRQRLQIALDAAKGLEYLHHGCQPSIFHRDVKSSNILLSGKLEAKVADFGLSKLTDDGQTHVMTMVKGTLGYLDPEYNSTGMLTEKSDVYSFGVVLLEIMCGQPPIAREGPQKFIVDRVRTAMNTGTLERLIDPALRGDYRLESAWRYAEIAMSCVSISAASRPYMNKVVIELSQVLEIEFGGQQGWTMNSDSTSEVALNSNYSGTSYSNVTEQPSQFFHSEQPRPY